MTTRKTRMQNANRFKLGLFGMNCSGSFATTAPERWQAGWPENLEAARLADEAGLEFILPIARWMGYGGQTDRQGTSFESLSWASALLASTEDIVAFSTIHVPLVHPVFAAKSIVTADHVGQGRFGINIVSGWNVEEFAMFGIPLREHDERYDYSAEWVSILKRIYSETGPFDYDGKYFNLKNVDGKPKPWGEGRPMLMSAGSSPAGRNFAVKHTDCLFMVITEEAQDRLRRRAGARRARRGQGRLVRERTSALPPDGKGDRGLLSLSGAREGRLGGGRTDHCQARRWQFSIAFARIDAQDERACHQRRRDLPGDRQLRRGRGEVLAAVRSRTGRDGSDPRQLRATKCRRFATKSCRAWSA